MNVVTAVEILVSDAHCLQFKPWVEVTAKNSTIKVLPSNQVYLRWEYLELTER